MNVVTSPTSHCTHEPQCSMQSINNDQSRLLYFRNAGKKTPMHQYGTSKLCCRTLTTTTHLIVHYPGQPGWAGNGKNTHSLAPYLCGYCQISLIHFLHLLQSITSSLFSCQLLVFFHNLSLGFLWSTSTSYTLHFIIHEFFTNHSCPFMTHVHTISTYFAAAL